MKLLFVLSVLLLFQSITSVSLRKKKLTEREKLEVIVFEELGKHANITVQQYREVFDATVKDIEGKPPVSEEMRKKLKEFKDFDTRVDNLPETLDDKFLDEVFDLHTLAEEIISKYRGSNTKNSDDRLIQRKLKKNGLETVISNSMYQYGVFEQNVQKRFTDWRALPESERKLNAKVVDWYKRYKAGEVKDNQLFLIVDRIDYD